MRTSTFKHYQLGAGMLNVFGYTAANAEQPGKQGGEQPPALPLVMRT